MEKNYLVKSTVEKEVSSEIKEVDKAIYYLEKRIAELKAQQKRFEIKILKQEIKKKRIEAEAELLSEEELSKVICFIDKVAYDKWEEEVRNILKSLSKSERVEYCKKWDISIYHFGYEEDGTVNEIPF